MAAPSENQKSPSSNNDGEIDKELNELLDDALEDFDKPGVGKQTAGAEGGKPKETLSSGGDPISDAFAEQFSDELSKEFEDAMKTFLADDPAMMQQIEKLADAAGCAGDTAEGQKEFGETLKQTLNSLAQNTEGLQDHGAAGMDDEMMKMFSGMGLEAGGQDDGFMPMMQNMMKTLLSKDVLYPSLKEISEKYPAWLTENKGKITDKEHTNYTKQSEIIKDILAEFETENSTDSEEVKKQRFEKIMDMMQKMQDLGQPPKDIVGDMAPGLDFDANGVPKFPGTSEACCVM
ncbi:peroxisomal biogenesis factor 19-like [Mercenaria mercenaria]|uniref:peroxisomal biogenesis factor 19-like n=1 Tax=Mercenaria mercenaria TaxID=6596 RepID=UPI00234EE96F|nr:peroxisomal biogenesis factor 19-like [Mercenaria mercenaria]